MCLGALWGEHSLKVARSARAVQRLPLCLDVVSLFCTHSRQAAFCLPHLWVSQSGGQISSRSHTSRARRRCPGNSNNIEQSSDSHQQVAIVKTPTKEPNATIWGPLGHSKITPGQVCHILKTSKGHYFEGFRWWTICSSLNPVAGAVHSHAEWQAQPQSRRVT